MEPPVKQTILLSPPVKQTISLSQPVSSANDDYDASSANERNEVVLLRKEIEKELDIEQPQLLVQANEENVGGKTNEKRLYSFPRLKYRPEIDGIRAWAVIPVILFHFHLGFPGGFTGVDVFFVLSGYLITAIMLYEHTENKFSMLNFWNRRVRRLFPAMVFMLTIILIIYWHQSLGSLYVKLTTQAYNVLLTIANFHFSSQGGYFFAELDYPLLHCWSLAVEEQFYFFFPLLLWILRIVGLGPRGCIIVLLVIFVTSFALSVANNFSDNFSFYLLPCRAWELTMGALLVFFDQGKSVFENRRIFAEIAGWTGVGLITLPYFIYSKTTAYPSYNALLPCVGTIIFIASQRPCLTTAGKLFAFKAPVYIGKLSYALYLWHWPIFVILKLTTTDPLDELLSTGRIFFGLGMTIVMSIFSYFCIEQVFRSKQKVPGKFFYPAVTLVYVGLFTFSWIVAHDGSIGGIRGELVSFPRPSHAFKPLEMSTMSLAQSVTNTTSNVTTTISLQVPCMKHLTSSQWDELLNVNPAFVMQSNILASKGWGSISTRFGGPLIVGTGSIHPKIVIFGSSHCLMYGPLLERLAIEYNTKLAFLCENGYQAWVLPPRPVDLYRLSLIQQWQPDTLAIIDFWGNTGVGPFPWYAGYDFELAFEQLATGTNLKKILMLGDVPSINMERTSGDETLKRFAYLSYREDGDFNALVNLYEEPYYSIRRIDAERNIAAAAALFNVKTNTPTRVKYVEVANTYFLDAQKRIQVLIHDLGTLAYKDFDHLNPDGARRLEEVFRKELFNERICPN